MKKIRPIGVYGGTFNPIHVCHLRIAEQVQSELKLDEVIFIPTGDPPHKEPTSLAPAHHRLAMVQLALENHSSFSVSDVEIQSSGLSYTIDTITALKHTYGPDTELSFIMGLDAFLEFPTWKQSVELFALCHFVICSRPATTFRSLASFTGLAPIAPQSLEALDTGHTHRLDVRLPTGRQLTLLSLPPCEASASTIRRELAQGHAAPDWLPPSVESYIMTHHLYHQ